MKLLAVLFFAVAIATSQAKTVPEFGHELELFSNGVGPNGILDDILKFLANMEKIVNDIIAKLPPVLELKTALDAKLKITDLDVKGLKGIKSTLNKDNAIFHFEFALPTFSQSINTNVEITLPNKTVVTIGGARKVDITNLKIAGQFYVDNNQLKDLKNIVVTVDNVDVSVGIPIVEKFIKEHVQTYLKENHERISDLISIVAQDSINEYIKLNKLKIDSIEKIKAALNDVLSKLPEEAKIANVMEGTVKVDGIKITGLNKGHFMKSLLFDYYSLEAPELIVEANTDIALNGDGFLLGQKWTLDHKATGNKVTLTKPRGAVKIKLPPILKPTHMLLEVSFTEEKAKHELKDVKLVSGDKTIDAATINKLLDDLVPQILNKKQDVIKHALAALVDLGTAIVLDVADEISKHLPTPAPTTTTKKAF